MIIPPHLVVLGLKFAAGRVALKGVEIGIDRASRHYAQRAREGGADPEKVEGRAKTTARHAKRAIRLARHVAPALTRR